MWANNLFPTMPLGVQRGLIVIGLVLLIVGCEHADPLSDNGGGEPGTTLSEIQTTIFSTTCAVSGCHDGSGNDLPGSMDLRSGQAYASIVGVPSARRPELNRVEPGDPDNSYLIHKLENAPGIIGSPMPPTGPLSTEQIAMIREWIAEGAEDN